LLVSIILKNTPAANPIAPKTKTNNKIAIIFKNNLSFFLFVLGGASLAGSLEGTFAGACLAAFVVLSAIKKSYLHMIKNSTY
jgi:hypothetical protein